MDIKGNTIFIPGATSGIGLALAVELQAKGNEVIVGGRRTGRLTQISDDHPGIHTIEIDTTDLESVRQATNRVLTEYPEVNVLVAMAGIMQVEDWTSPDDALTSAENTVTTNLLGPIRLIAGFIGHLQTRPDATIMTVSSGLAFTPLKATPSYNATKAAIHMFSETLRLQLAGTSVKVMELQPPSVATDLLPGQRESSFAMPLEEFIEEVISLIESQPAATEIQVERVKFLRYAEARGNYKETVAALNSTDPHGNR